MLNTATLLFNRVKTENCYEIMGLKQKVLQEKERSDWLMRSETLGIARYGRSSLFSLMLLFFDVDAL